MKYFFLSVSTRLSADERKQYEGYRFNNGAAFVSLAPDLTSAVIAGDFPAIEAALEDAEIEFEKVDLEHDIARAKAAKKAALAAEQAAELDAANPEEMEAAFTERLTSAEKQIAELKAAKAESEEATAEAEKLYNTAQSELDTATARIAELEAAAEAPTEDSAVKLFDVFRITDGKRGKGPSKHNVTLEEAEAFVAEKPDVEYQIVPDGQ